jgi:iron complex transport system substrate-binding protein
MSLPRVLTALTAALLLSACAGSSTDLASASAGAVEDDAFPVAIEHKYGATEIAARPERVVSIGFNDHDTVLALDVTPVAVRDWFGDQPFATWPWARDELGDAEPVVLPPTELDFERIATLEPDLIVAVFSGISEDDYATLSAIAPTLPQSDAYVDFGVPWQEQTRFIARALGEQERAEALIAEVEARFADTHAEYPQLEGATGVVALAGGADGNYHAYAAQDLRGRFLTSLGLELPDAVVDLAGDAFFATISRERLDVVDADVLVWITNPPATEETVTADPLYQQLRVASEGRDLFLPAEEPLAGALSFSSVLSLPFLLDELVPQLADAVEAAGGERR